VGAGVYPFARSSPTLSEVVVRRIPAWILLVLAVLTAALLYVGWDERHHLGYVPLALGVLWALFVLGSAPKIFKQDDH
jgi:hypothetical protein